MKVFIISIPLLLVSCSFSQKQQRSISSTRPEYCMDLLKGVLSSTGQTIVNKVLGDTRPIRLKKVVKDKDIQRRYNDIMGQIESLGVSYKSIDLPTLLKTEVEKGKIKINGNRFSEKIFEIIELPKTKGKKDFRTKVLLHPELPIYVEKLKRMSYKLVIDTSMEFAETGGYFNDVDGVIAILPDSSWTTFLHEFQHVEFIRYVSPIFDSLEETAMDQESLEFLIKNSGLSELSSERVSRIVELIEDGFPELAVNETLSGEVELEALGFRRYLPFKGSKIKDYTLRHQITELSKINLSERTLKQKKSLGKARRDFVFQKLYRFGAYSAIHSANLAASIAVAGGVIAIYNSFKSEPEDYIQFLYKKGDKIPFSAQKKDGRWVRFSSTEKDYEKLQNKGRRTEIRMKQNVREDGTIETIFESRNFDDNNVLFDTRFHRRWTEKDENGNIVLKEEELSQDYDF